MDVFVSVVIYVSCFGISIYGTKKAANIKSYYPKKKVLFLLYAILAIIPPCLLAAIRDYSVGVDTYNYAVNIVSLAKYSHNFNVVYLANGGGTEILYIFLVLILSSVTTDGTIILFALQLLTILPIFIVAIKMRKKVSASLVLGTYFLLFYNNSLNLCKQSVACSFLLLGTIYLFDDKNKKNCFFKAVIYFAIGCMFHKVALFGVVMILVIRWGTSTAQRLLIRIPVYLITAFFPILLSRVIEVGLRAGLFSERFLKYIDLFVVNGKTGEYGVNPFSVYFIIEIVLRLMLIICPIVLCSKGYDDRFMSFLKMSQILGFLIYITILYGMKISYGQRFSMFLDYFAILFIPYSVKNWALVNSFQKKIFVYTIMFIYWFGWIVLLGWSGSGIYKFR